MPIALRILLITDGLFLLASAMIGPIYAIFVEEIGGDILTAGASFAVFSLVLGLLILMMGKIEDVVLKETELWICAGYFIIAFGFFGYLLIKTPVHLFFIQAILAIGVAVESPAFCAVYSRHLDKKRTAFQWGAWDATHNLTAALGALIGSAIAAFLGFNILFILMGCLALLSCLIILFLPRRVL